MIHFLQFKQIYYAATKLMVTNYNTKGQGKDESIFNS